MKQEKCACGFTISHPLVTAKANYSKLGYFWLSLAFSAKPKEIIFICQNCGEILLKSSDNEIIEQYRFNSEIFKF